MGKVIIRSASENIDRVVAEVMEFCKWKEIVKKDAKVIIKPNLSTDDPEKVESSNTDPRLVEAVCKVLLARTKNITIAESDGARYPADRAAENTGVLDVVRRLGIRWVNLSNDVRVAVNHDIFNSYNTELSKIMLEADVIINMPVIKTHALTVFTGSLKNLWGCVPRYDRIWMHKHLDRLLVDLQKIHRPQINIMDGIVCVEGRGPTNGTPRRLNLVLAGTDPVALDSVCMRLIGLDPYTSRHIVMAADAKIGSIREGDITIDGDFEKHKVKFMPPVSDFAVTAMNYMTRYRLFVKYILFNETIFRNVRRLVVALRKIGLLNDAPREPKRKYSAETE